MTDLEFTGERLVPGKSPSDLEAEHRARYEFARKLVKNMKVLDIGCGAGYGSSMLGETASSVTGVDIDDTAVAHATQTYGTEKVCYIAGDVTHLPFNDYEFDAVVCLEVIEHIEKPRAMLTEIARVLQYGGMFIVSTPNGAVKVSSMPNPFHVREYELGEFTDLLKGFFPLDSWSLKIFGQFIKGKNYSSSSVALKNLYLTVKGKLGLTSGSKSLSPYEINPEYEFKIDDRELAEYLIAVIKGK